MSVPNYIQKTLKMKPEVSKIFEDLEKWHDHCRLNLINFNPADLYKSADYKAWQKEQDYQERKAKRESKAKQG